MLTTRSNPFWTSMREIIAKHRPIEIAIRSSPNFCSSAFLSLALTREIRKLYSVAGISGSFAGFQHSHRCRSEFRPSIIRTLAQHTFQTVTDIPCSPESRAHTSD